MLRACPHCGEIYPLSASVLYYNPQTLLAVWWVQPEHDGFEAAQTQAKQFMGTADYPADAVLTYTFEDFRKIFRNDSPFLPETETDETDTSAAAHERLERTNKRKRLFFLFFYLWIAYPVVSTPQIRTELLPEFANSFAKAALFFLIPLLIAATADYVISRKKK